MDYREQQALDSFNRSEEALHKLQASLQTMALFMRATDKYISESNKRQDEFYEEFMG